MARVRPAAYAALSLVLLVSATAAAAIPRSLAGPLAAVGWPPSSALVIAEVVTGGASASDEYVEVANAGSSPADLAGLEIAYATSSGATVTKKAAWTASLLLAPGQHLLVANSSGAYAPIADAVYATGLAATGGAIILRATGGGVVDAVGWGDATNAFVEGSAAPAPGAGQSIERLPGSGGNTVDTNSNRSDFIVTSAPVPQNLAAAPVPPPSPSPSPSSSPSAEPSPSVSPTDTPAPTASATPTESATTPPEPSVSATPSPTPSENPSPTPTVTPTPSPAPTDPPTPTPTASPTPSGTALPTDPPTPTPTPSAAPTESPAPTEPPTPTDTPPPTSPPSPDPNPSDTPSPLPSATETAGPTPSESPVPSATQTPVPTASPSPTPEPTIAPLAITAARSLPDGSSATIEGVLTTALGALESGRTGFVQDTSGGIALYLDAASGSPIPAGTRIRTDGVVGSRYGERTLRVATSDVAVIAVTGLPAPLDVATGTAGEALEGVRLRLTGVVTETPSSLADGLAFTIDDGSGPVRVVVAPAALDGATVGKGMVATAIGPLGQRDSSGTDMTGYRLFATLPGEFAVGPAPTPTPEPSATPSATPAESGEPSTSPVPSPTPTPTATASPSASPSSPAPTASPLPSPTVTPPPISSPTPVPTPRPSATPTPEPQVLTVGQARSAAVGRTVLVRGVVTAEAGRLGTPSLLAIGDATGGLPVRLASGMAAPPRGTLVDALGVVAAPYGQTELRLVADGLTSLGSGVLPVPQHIAIGAVGESVEGRLVSVSGTVSTGAAKSTSGDIVLVVTGADGASLRVYADGSAGVQASSLKKGLVATFTGIAGQRASHKGALDGYRLWLRDTADIVRTSSPGASPTPSPAPSGSGAPAAESIATARVRDGATVTVEGVVTADRSLLDATGRLTVLEDATAAIEIQLPAPDASVRLGTRLRVTGVVGKAWGAPRLRAEQVTLLGSATPDILDLRVAPGPATEWRLVRVSGTVTSVHHTGDRWVAQLDAGAAGTIPVAALDGAGIAVTAIEAGHRATIVGIVKRPYPTASDRRYQVLPRRASDVILGAAVAASPGASGGAPGGAARSGGTGQTADSGRAASDAPAADLRDLATRVGQRVRVGGVVTEATSDGFRLDDGTGQGRIVLEAEASDLGAVVGPGDALDAIGTVEIRDGAVVVVRDPADVVLVGDLGGDPEASASPAAVAALAISSTRPTLTVGPVAASAPEPGGVAAIVAALAIVAVAAGLAARRFRDRRRLSARVRTRLVALATAAATPWSAGSGPAATAPAGRTGVTDA